MHVGSKKEITEKADESGFKPTPKKLLSDFQFMDISETYVPIGRELLLTGTIGKGELARITRDIATRAYVIPKRGAVPDMIAEAEDVVIPTFEIATNPMARIVDGISKERLEKVGRKTVAMQEDMEVFKALSVAVPEDHTIYCKEKELKKAFRTGVAMIEDHLLSVDKVVCHTFRRDKYSRLVEKYNLKNPSKPIKLMISVMCPRNTAYFLAPKEYVGRMPIRQEMTVIDADDPKALRLGIVVFEEIGIGIVNEYATSQVTIG